MRRVYTDTSALTTTHLVVSLTTALDTLSYTVNWNLVYLGELLVVMTDRCKMVRIHVRNAPRVHRHKCFDDDASLTSLTPPGKRWCRVPDALIEVQSCWNTKIVSGQLVHVWQWPLSSSSSYLTEIVVATVAFFILTLNLSNLIVINPVLGKNLEHLLITR